MHCEIEVLPPAPELGLDGDPIWGGSVLSGRPLSVAMAARDDAIVALAGKMGRLRSEDSREAVMPAVALTEMKTRRSLLGGLLARLVGFLPGFATRFCVRTLGACGGIEGLRDLLPLAPLVLAGADPKLRVRERLRIALDASPSWDGEGEITVSMEVHGRLTAAAIARYRKAFGANWGVSGGFLLLRQRLALRWREDTPTPRFIRAVSRNMLALSDLSSHPAILPLAAPEAAKSKTVAPTLAMQISAAYQPDALADATACLHELLTLAASIPSEEGYRGLAITATLNPKAAELPVGDLLLGEIAIELPEEYPPIQNCELWLTGLNKLGRRLQKVETIVSSEGSSARLKVLEQAVFEPGCTLTVQLVFRHDASAIGQAADKARLRLGLVYRYPLSGIGEVSLLPVSGHVASKTGEMLRMASSYDLTLNATASVPLGNLLFPSSLRRPLTINAGSRDVDMGFMRDLANRLADEGIEVRSMLESQAGAYADGSFLCDLHGRYEKSMAGPDVHIRVLRSRDGGTGRPSTRFELTVLGRAEGEAERARIEAVNRSICEVLTSISALADGAFAETTGTIPDGPASAEGGAMLAGDILGRMEALIGQLAHLVGSLRRNDMGGSNE